MKVKDNKSTEMVAKKVSSVAAASLLLGAVSGAALTQEAQASLVHGNLGSGAQVRARLLEQNKSFSGTSLYGANAEDSGKGAEGKCGEGKCGGSEGDDKGAEGKCGEGKCGEGKGEGDKGAEGKCGEGKCGDKK